METQGHVQTDSWSFWLLVQATNARFKDTKLKDTDWTDAILRRDVQRQLCKTASGTNPITNVDTLESLMC